MRTLTRLWRPRRPARLWPPPAAIAGTPRGRRMVVGGVLVSALTLTAAVTCAAGPDTGSDTIRLGMLASGATDAFVKGARLAVLDANDGDRDGVLGREVELVVRDDVDDPATAARQAAGLADGGVAVALGAPGAGSGPSATQAFHRAGVPMIIPVGNSAELTGSGYDNVFMLNATAAAQGEFAQDRLHRLGARTPMLIHDGTGYPSALAAATADAVAASGTPTPAPTHRLVDDEQGYAAARQAVTGARADAVYFTGYPAAAQRLIRTLRDGGFTGVIAVGDRAVEGPLLPGLSQAQSQDVYATVHVLPEAQPELAEWSDRYRAEYATSPGFGAVEAYDAVNLALDAIRRAGTTDHAAVGTAISHSEDVPLLAGPVTFAPDGTRANARLLLLRAAGGRFEMIGDNTYG